MIRTIVEMATGRNAAERGTPRTSILYMVLTTRAPSGDNSLGARASKLDENKVSATRRTRVRARATAYRKYNWKPHDCNVVICRRTITLPSSGATVYKWYRSRMTGGQARSAVACLQALQRTYSTDTRKSQQHHADCVLRTWEVWAPGNVSCKIAN